MIKFFIRLFFAAILCIPMQGMAQQYGYFSGTVRDRSNGEALIGANIILKQDPTLGTSTNIEGKFTLTLEPGNYLFNVSFTGMKTDTVNVRIIEGQVVNRNIMLEPYVNELQGIEIKAGKFDRKLEEMTVSLEIIKPGLIESKNTRDIKTILDYTPGLNIVDNEPQIRGGSGFTFGVGSKVAVIVDDMPMVSPEAGRPYWDFIPLENIEQIEVEKGASSVLSGTSALSGAIRIRTAQPGLKPITKVNVYSGFYSSPPDKSQRWWNDFPYIEGANFFHSQKIDHTDLTIGADINFDHNYIGAPRPMNSHIDNSNSNFTDKQMASQKARVNFNFRQRSKRYQGLNYGVNGNFMYHNSPMVLVWLDDKSGFFRAYPGAVSLQKQYIGYLDPFINYYSRIGVKHSLKARVLYSDSQMTNNQSSKNTLIYADYNLKREYKFLQGLDFIGGISTQYSASEAASYSHSGSDFNHLFNLSGYAQFENNFFGILNLSIGARIEYYDLNSHQTDLKPIFRAGMNLRILKETYLRMSYGQGYRYPTIAERFIHTTVGSFGFFANPDLKPESSWNAEVGLKQGFKFLKYFGYLDIAVFQQEYSNTIEFLFGFWDSTYQTGPGFKFVNTGRSRVTGVDISVSGMAKLATNTKLITSLGYNYILPVCLDPYYVYARDFKPGASDTIDYIHSSVDPSRNILKYRFLQTVKGDIELDYKAFSIGVSGKYFSKLENLDKAIEEFEIATKNAGGSLQPVLYMDYFRTHNNGNFIMDARVSYQISDHHKIALISSNLLNRIYSLRPLKAEQMRTIVLQYSLKI